MQKILPPSEPLNPYGYRCDTCIAWVRVSSEGGSCKMNPPQACAVVLPSPGNALRPSGGIQVQPIVNFPGTAPHDFCLQHRAVDFSSH